MPKLNDRATQTQISEIFSSLQGEGPYLGVRQIFVRFGLCNMHCVYCDELDKMKEAAFSVYPLETLLNEIVRMEKSCPGHHSVSLTGGEPLFYAPFLRNLLPELKKLGFKTYLETNGTMARELAGVVDWIDHIAMDLKPPSSTGDRAFWGEHEEFLKVALKTDVYVKVVVTESTTAGDIDRCVRLVKNINPKLPFIFQPKSEAVGISQAALNAIEQNFFPAAAAHLTDVRLIPQMHKIWGVR